MDVKICSDDLAEFAAQYGARHFDVGGIIVSVSINGPHCGGDCQYDKWVWIPRHCKHTQAVVLFCRNNDIDIVEHPMCTPVYEQRPLTEADKFFNWVCGRESYK